jgi:hypothetical protein
MGKAKLFNFLVDYGYLKVTYFLQNESGYHINHKKVFRLMQVHKLIYQSKTQRVVTKKWVTNLCTRANYSVLIPEV